MPVLRLGSSMCQCPTCGLFFSRTSTFDAHRVGSYEVGRTCMTVAEMEAKGMVNRNGVWGGAGPAQALDTWTAVEAEHE